MGYPHPETVDQFRGYVDSVFMRRWVKRPQAFGIGAVRYGEQRQIVEAIFPRLNCGKCYGSAAAFMDVAHYRDGNTVFEPDFFDFKALQQLLNVFLPYPEVHPNTAAMLEAYRLMCSPYNMKPVIVFVGDIHDPPPQHPAYDVFMRSLVLLAVTGDEKHLHYKAE